MTNVCGAGVLLRYTFDDSSSFHVWLSELFSEEMRLLLEHLQDLHGRIVSMEIKPGALQVGTSITYEKEINPR
jgi:hypothetical protein